MYGYRQSPKLWGDHRDNTLRKKKIELSSGWLVLRQMASEPSMWLIVEEKDTGEETIRGLMLVYVDDLLICGEEDAIERTTECVRQTWETSTPEKIGSEKGVRFLGMELWRKEGVSKKPLRRRTRSTSSRGTLEKIKISGPSERFQPRKMWMKRSRLRKLPAMSRPPRR